MIRKFSPVDILFDVFNAAFLLFLTFVTFYPMYYVLVASVTDTVSLNANPGFLWRPYNFNLGAYKLAFVHPLIISGYKNTLFVLGVSLFVNILLTLFAAYFLSTKKLFFKKPVLFMMMFTMFFSGGMIPAYLNIRDLGLYNSLWALILPGAISLHNTFIYRSAIDGIPESLSESARIDGANDFTILFRIIFPLIKSTTIVLLLYYGMGHWNSWFPASLYLRDNDKLPIQNILRSILIANSNILGNTAGAAPDEVNDFAETIKYAAIVITTVPVLCVYPFLQKYFVKGTLIGAVKG
jgi:putative aldouronate transport system permease protein